MVRCVLQPALAWRGSFEKRHMLTFGMPTWERARKARGEGSGTRCQRVGRLAGPSQARGCAACRKTSVLKHACDSSTSTWMRTLSTRRLGRGWAVLKQRPAPVAMRPVREGRTGTHGHAAPRLGASRRAQRVEREDDRPDSQVELVPGEGHRVHLEVLHDVLARRHAPRQPGERRVLRAELLFKSATEAAHFEKSGSLEKPRAGSSSIGRECMWMPTELKPPRGLQIQRRCLSAPPPEGR